jgi:O-antigen/teichoic acid export membrane protein
MAAPEPRSRRLSLRFGLTTVDQGIASLSNFAVGAAIARIAGLGAFGAYALVYAGWLLLAGFHRSLVTDPMNIENDVHADEVARNVALGLAGELTLGLGAGAAAAAIGVVLLAVHQHEYGVCFIGISPWFPCLLAQDYWRWVGFMKAQPQKALANDVLFDVVQVATFAVLYVVGMRSALLAIISWGVGATAGAAFGVWQHRQQRSWVSLKAGVGRIRERWHFSRWLVATNVVSTATSQSTLVLSGALLGPAGIGGLKAGLNLVMGPSMVFIQAAGSVGLPEASKQLARHGWPGLRRVQRWITAASVVTVGVLVGVIVLFGRHLLVLVYGPSFGRFAGVADIVAVSFLVTTLAHGAILSLKTTRQTHRLVPVCAVSLVVSVVSIATLAPVLGITGAAVANLIGNVTRTIGLLVAHWTSSRRCAEAMVPTPDEQPAGLSARFGLGRLAIPAAGATSSGGPHVAPGDVGTSDVQRSTGAALAAARAEVVVE